MSPPGLLSKTIDQGSTLKQSSTQASLKDRRPPQRIRHAQGDQEALPWGDAVPALSALAKPLRLRVYRDKCGDENITGRFGEIFRYAPDRLAVQLGGPYANGHPAKMSARLTRCRIRQAKKDARLRLLVEGNKEALFVAPERLLSELPRVVWAYRAYGTSQQSVIRALAAQTRQFSRGFEGKNRRSRPLGDAHDSTQLPEPIVRSGPRKPRIFAQGGLTRSIAVTKDRDVPMPHGTGRK